MFCGFFSAGGLIFLAALPAISSLRVLHEYKRGVVFLLGRFRRVEGPGLVPIVPATR